MVKRGLQLLYAVLILHVLWALGAWLVDRPILPTPWAVYMYFPHLLNMDLWWNIYFSLYRLALSLVFATLIGVPLGIMSVRLPKFGALFEPLVYFTYPIPKIALGTAIATLFFTEMYGTQYGMGYYIMDQWNRLDYLAMFGGIIVISVVSFLLFLTISGLERYCLRWQNK